mmetsp:Transcript_11819/g.47686  ORF Transcript_11819/g.47686 Transcript_11819/m.47686 type:complete len:155 (+) Transcript_11819:610-1074(+)
MSLGERAELVVRADYAYGEAGLAALGVPGGATVAYDVTLVDVERPADGPPKLLDDVVQDDDDAGVSQSKTKTVMVDGAPVVLDELGPVVVSPTGQLSRILNWTEMDDEEQAKMAKFVMARNRKRLKALGRDVADEDWSSHLGSAGGASESSSST